MYSGMPDATMSAHPAIVPSTIQPFLLPAAVGGESLETWRIILWHQPLSGIRARRRGRHPAQRRGLEKTCIRGGRRAT